MRIEAENLKLYKKDNETYMLLKINKKCKKELFRQADYLINSEKLILTLDKKRKSRSLNANAMFWSLCTKLAEVVGIPNDEMYLNLIENYGEIEIITAEKDIPATELVNLLSDYKISKSLGEVMIDGKEYIQYKCYIGSSKYNTKQMARLINGTISDCEELGIPIYPDNEVEKAVSEWGR